jgi:hypothetical protein
MDPRPGGDGEEAAGGLGVSDRRARRQSADLRRALELALRNLGRELAPHGGSRFIINAVALSIGAAVGSVGGLSGAVIGALVGWIAGPVIQSAVAALRLASDPERLAIAEAVARARAAGIRQSAIAVEPDQREFRTPYAYRSGSLAIYVDATRQGVEELVWWEGTFRVGFSLRGSEQLAADWDLPE